MARPALLDDCFVEIDHPFPSGLPENDGGVITEEIRREAQLALCMDGVVPHVEHLSVQRTGYTHHGIALGDGTVVHFTGEPLRKLDATVQRTSAAAFLRGGRPIEGAKPPQLRLHRSLTALLALLHVGMTGYHLGKRNCEHFATYCESGGWHSHQIHALTDSHEGGASGGWAAAEMVIDATLGRLTRWLESLTATDEVHAYSVEPEDAERAAYFYGYLFDADDGPVVLAPVRQELAAHDIRHGFWGRGLPWAGFDDWTSDAPPPEDVTWVGDVFFDAGLVPYVRTADEEWYRGGLELGPESIPPLPEPHPALVERSYPIEWFE